MACPHCGAVKDQQTKGHSPKGLPRYKCLVCLRQYTPGTNMRLKPKMEVVDVVRACIVCGKETTNPKFCSRSCSAIYTNHEHPKRQKKTRFCKNCGAEIETGKTVCDNCNSKRSIDYWSGKTLADIEHPFQYQVSNLLRGIARRVYQQANRPYKCQNCGYDKHVEICHIRAINTFPNDTPVLVVSGIDNLIALCPNCHWEFDHGLLNPDTVPPDP